MKTLAVTVAYLMYDLICCLFDKKFNLDNSVHHIVSIVGIVAGLAYQKVKITIQQQLLIFFSSFFLSKVFFVHEVLF